MSDPKPLTAFQQTYHWRNKNCGAWSHDWIKKTLPGTKLDRDGQSAEIKEVTSVSGDCDLGQRKGKLLTIYDLDVEMKWTGTTKDGDDVEGTAKIPEFSHEVLDGLSEYVYEFALTSPSSPAAEALLSSIKAHLPALLTERLNTFRPALLSAHGLFADASPSASGTSTPAGYAPAPPTKDAVASASSKPQSPAPAAEKAAVGATETVEVSAQLQISGDDLWTLLTDPSRIPLWSRSAAKMSLQPEGEYELFAGNVKGKIKEVEAPKKLVQSWMTRSGQWPAGHYGTLTTALSQGSDSTTVTFTLDGVPKGQTTDLERALDQFYIRGLKQMGLVLSSSSRSYRTPPARLRPHRPPQEPRHRGKNADQQSFISPQLLAAGAILGLGAVFMGLVVYSISGASRPP